MIDCSTPASLVEEYERYSPPGDPGAAPLLAEARAAVAALVASTTARIFDDSLQPRSADTVAQFAFMTSRPVAAAAVTADRIELSRRALATNEPLAAMLRSKEALDEIAAAAESAAVPAHHLESIGAARARAARDACRTYRRAVAELLAGAKDHPLGAAAHALLAAEALADRLPAAEEKHRQAAAAAAEHAAAEARAAAAAADAALDASEAERLLVEALRLHGLPETLTGGIFVEAQRARLAVLVPVRRRLKASSVAGVRALQGFFNPRDLAASIGERSVADLEAIVVALDHAEAEAERSRPWTT